MLGTDVRTSYLRRGVGLVIGCCPAVLLLASLFHALDGHDQLKPVGLTVELIALVIGGMNFYLSFIRGRIDRRKMHVSGFPLIGSVLAVIGGALGFGSLACALVGLLALGVDTGGFVWFLVATWRDRSTWDARA